MDKRTQNFISVLSLMAVIVIGIVLLPFGNRGNMIEYYCSPNSVFFWINLSKTNYCGLIIVFAHILIATIIFMICYGLWLKIQISIINHRINIIPVNKVNSHVNEEWVRGFSFGIGLEIQNNNYFDIVQCSVTLESIQPVFIQNGKLVCLKEKWLEDIGSSVNKKLRFTDSTCETSISGKSKEKTIVVAHNVNVKKITKKGEKETLSKDNFKHFQFTFCNSKTGGGSITGLYRVKVRVDGKADGNEIKKRFDGYIYSFMDNSLQHSSNDCIYWAENPLRDKKIINDSLVARVH
jgi:hypothetical protein